MGIIDRQATLIALFVTSLAVLVWQVRHAGGYDVLLARPRSSSPPTRDQPKYDQWSLTTVTSAFRAYEESANTETRKMRASHRVLSPAHLDLVGQSSLDYPAKLQRLDEATSVNSVVTSAIVDLATRELGVNGSEVEKRDGGSLFRTREALLHFVRDWSEEGREEREVIFKPILDVLKEVPVEKRGSLRVLVPGSGLGRLAWEISQLGFKATANELSWYMNLGLRFLIHPSTTSQVHQHTIQPFAHRFSNQRTNDLLFRSVHFPDVVPRYSSHFTIAEGDFLKQERPEGANGKIGYDYIVTQFFIDTGFNVVATLEQIHSLLAPGGTWINLGPLLWAGGGSVAMELSLDEVLALAKGVGFEVLGEEQEVGNGQIPPQLWRRTIPCEYTADKMGTFQRIYQSEFWVARKT